MVHVMYIFKTLKKNGEDREESGEWMGKTVRLIPSLKLKWSPKSGALGKPNRDKSGEKGSKASQLNEGSVVHK